MELRERVMAYIDEHEREMIELWKNLVQLESPSSDTERVAQAAAHLDTYCGALGLCTKKYMFEHAGPSLAAWTEKGELPGVCLVYTSRCVKETDFAVHSGPEELRHEFDAVVSDKDLWETYLPAFEACVKEAKVEGVMGAYNRRCV